jgi:hypothetical protein
MAGRVTIQASLNELPQGSVTIAPLTISPTVDNLYEALVVDLASGANTITVPTWATGVLIIPTSTNTVALTLKGVTGDAGIEIGPASPTLLTFASTPPASFVITAASAVSTPTSISFF